MRKVALMTKKILVTEDLVQEGIDSLTEHGYEVDMLIDPTAEELIGAIAPYDADRKSVVRERVSTPV